MAAVPNATIIGFTGTPIDRTAQGEGTFKIFGAEDKQGYLDKYSIAESIKDETTLPIHYTMAPSDMTVPMERLDEDFFALAEAEGVTDIDELNKVLDRAVSLRTFLSADDRIEKGRGLCRRAFPGESGATRLQGVPGWSQPRGVREVQARTRQVAAARMVGADLYGECRRYRRPPTGCGTSTLAGKRGGSTPDVQEGGRRPERF